jgi:hypothetical protein
MDNQLGMDNLAARNRQINFYGEAQNNKGNTPQNEMAKRRLAESEAKAEAPNEWFNGSDLKPEFSSDFEQLIQMKMRKTRGDISLPSFANESSTDDEFELVQ